MSSSSSSSSSGSSGCTEITPDAFAVDPFDYLADGYAASYGTTISPDQGDTTDPDDLDVEFFGSLIGGDGDQTGTHDLTMDGDDNYSTCSRCVILYSDPDVGGTLFFQQSGTLVVAAGSDQLNGTVSATLTDVTLVEVTIDQNNVSTPVPGGACLHITSANVTATAPAKPTGWTCDSDLYSDGSRCDCGCGIADPDCVDNTSDSCDACFDVGSCDTDTTDSTCANISATDNSTCQ